jgi:DNA-binding LytR/AlgR family response regulator
MENKIVITADSKVLFLNEEEILYFKADGSYCIIKLTNNEVYRTSKNMKTVFEEVSNRTNFNRVHRSVIVNEQFVIGVEKNPQKSNAWVLVLKNLERLPISPIAKRRMIADLRKKTSN